jgi:serine/threonine protein kinase
LACGSNDEKEIKVKCGTPGYVAPEVLKNTHKFSKKLTFSALADSSLIY